MNIDPMTDVAELARGLTKAQRKALMIGATARGSALVCEWWGTNGLAQAAYDGMMRRLFLLNESVVAPYAHGGWELTPLGLALRQHLMSEEGK